MNTKFLSLIIILVSFTLACSKKYEPTVQPTLPIQMDSSFLNHFQQIQGVTAGMGTSSITLSDGRVLWLFGSSHLNDFNTASSTISCNANANNAAMIQTVSNQMQTLNSGNSDFIPSNEANTYFEPLHGYEFFDTLFIFAKKIGPGNYNKTYIAKFQFPSLNFIRVDSMNMNGCTFGYNVIPDTAIGFVYTFGLQQPNVNGVNSIFCARFPMNNINSPWFYYSNDAWYNGATSATEIATCPAENFSIRKVKGKYILLSQSSGFTCNAGNEIFSEVSAYPFGPYRNYKSLYKINDKLNGVSPATKSVMMHTQFLDGTNNLLVTYNINGYAPCISTCQSGEDIPDYYRMKTIRVPLTNIDPTW